MGERRGVVIDPIDAEILADVLRLIALRNEIMLVRAGKRRRWGKARLMKEHNELRDKLIAVGVVREGDGAIEKDYWREARKHMTGDGFVLSQIERGGVGDG